MTIAAAYAFPGLLIALVWWVGMLAWMAYWTVVYTAMIRQPKRAAWVAMLKVIVAIHDPEGRVAIVREAGEWILDLDFSKARMLASARRRGNDLRMIALLSELDGLRDTSKEPSDDHP